MSNFQSFEANWASPTGDTIAEVLQSKNISTELFSRQTNMSIDMIEALIVGELEITQAIAEKLSRFLGSTTNFWLRRDTQYRQDLKRLKEKRPKSKEDEWLSSLPVADMARFGWTRKHTRRADKLSACLNFFGVSSLNEWNEVYDEVIEAVAFRTSFVFENHPASVFAWLRQGEIEAENIACSPWNLEKFKQTLPSIRALTRVKDPADFIPELQRLCAECGIAVVSVRAPQGCRVSGAVRFISDDKAMIQLSFRHRSDDHLWFTFFHEVGHLLLHKHIGTFVDSLNMDKTIKEEREANDFAANVILPQAFEEELANLDVTNYRAIARFAKRVGVSAGLIVGQLQHRQLLPHNQFNALKIRYSW